MSRRIRAVEHGTCATGLSDAHHCLQDRILLHYTTIENAHKVRKISFLLEVQEIFSCRFSLLKHYQMPECFYSMLTSAAFELVQQFYHATEIGNAANAVSACADQT